jgi:hypothetical protein
MPTRRRAPPAPGDSPPAVDHTRSEFGIPVVSVVVPGMRETETD